MNDERDLVVETTATPEMAELAADALWAAGATAVGFDEQNDHVRLTASFPTDEAAITVAGEVVGARLVAVDRTWRDEWKRFAEPVEVGERLVVTPAWRDVRVGEGKLVLQIDPGSTFGSGSHASTRMLLAELDRRPPVGLTVLDVGCGSGILSVAAARLGAERVNAVDIDPDAWATTRRNAEVNGVADQIEIAGAELPGAQTADLALVNVTAAVHAEVGSATRAAVRAEGTILIAGLLPGQWRHVAGAYAGTEIKDVLRLDGWEGLRLQLG